MKLLIVAATSFEIAPLQHQLPTEVDYLITGVGSVATVFQLTQALHHKSYDLVLNAGIAGSYNPDLAIGQVVQVVNDCFADLGVDNKGSFLPIYKAINLNQDTKTPYNEFDNSNVIPQLAQVKAITVNTASGSEALIQERQQLYTPDIESMEGAGVFYVCKELQVPCLQIRSISNKVEPRDTKLWNIPLAIQNLSSFLIPLLTKSLAPLS